MYYNFTDLNDTTGHDINDLIDYVNKKIVNIGGKKLKESDFKLFSSEE